MIPTKIERYEQKVKDGNTTGEWELTNQIRYNDFDSIFSKNQMIEIPIQMGCKRVNPESYPQIETDYGIRFELNLKVLMRYIERTGRKTRGYSVKLLVDKSNSINVAETSDEATFEAVRSYYDAKSHLQHSVTLEYNKCHTYNLTSDKSINWYYLQEMFARRPELFYADKNYSFLYELKPDEQSPNNVSYRVFERTFRYWETLRGGVTARKRLNKIPTDRLVRTTHYYAKASDYWPNSPNKLSVPRRIVLGIFDDNYTTNRYSDDESFTHVYNRIGSIKIDVLSFKLNPEKQEKYDPAGCTYMDADMNNPNILINSN